MNENKKKQQVHIAIVNNVYSAVFLCCMYGCMYVLVNHCMYNENIFFYSVCSRAGSSHAYVGLRLTFACLIDLIKA